MKILHVTDTYLPTIGGLERAVHTLAHAQAAAGHEVHILTSQHPDEPAFRDDDGVRVHRHLMAVQKVPGAISDPRRPFHPTLFDPLFRRAVRKLLTDLQPDIAHTHGWSMFSTLGPAHAARIPVVSTSHDYGHVCATKVPIFSDMTVCDGPETGKCVSHAFHHYGPKGIAVALGLRASLGHARNGTTWTAISTAVARRGLGTPYYMPRMHVIPSYVPDSVLNPPEGPAPEWIPAEPFALFVGALGPFKGVGNVIDAQQALWSRGIRIPVLFLGTPRADTPNMHLPGIAVRHDVPHREVMHAWRAAKIGFAPSIVPEAFGQVIIEAMAAGTPIISTNHGGPADIIRDGIDGLLVPPNDVPALTAATERLWTDAALHASIVSNGHARAEHYTISQVLPQVDALYASLLHAPC